MPIRDKAGSGKRLKREEGGRKVRGNGYNGRRGDGSVRDRKVPQVRAVCLASSEEGKSGSGGVKKGARRGIEDSVPVRADEGGDSEERVGQV